MIKFQNDQWEKKFTLHKIGSDSLDLQSFLSNDEFFTVIEDNNKFVRIKVKEGHFFDVMSQLGSFNVRI